MNDDRRTAEVLDRLSPQSVQVLRKVAQMKGSTPEDVLRELLRDYIGRQLPPMPDLEGVIHAMGRQFYTLGYACGTAKRFLREWKNRS